MQGYRARRQRTPRDWPAGIVGRPLVGCWIAALGERLLLRSPYPYALKTDVHVDLNLAFQYVSLHIWRNDSTNRFCAAECEPSERVNSAIGDKVHSNEYGTMATPAIRTSSSAISAGTMDTDCSPDDNHLADQLGRVALDNRCRRRQAGAQKNVGDLLAHGRIAARPSIQSSSTSFCQSSSAARQSRGEAPARNQPRLLAIQNLDADLLQIERGRGASDNDVHRVVAQLRRATARSCPRESSRSGADRLRDRGAFNRRRQHLAGIKGITPICRCAACPDATASISRARWSRSSVIARALASTTLPSAVGAMPRAERSNSGAPNMSSSSASALVTAGWLLAMCSAARVSEPCC